MNKKSPANFGLSDFATVGNIASRLMGRGGKKKTRRALKKIDKRLGGIEETLEGMTANEMGAPAPEGLGEAQSEMLSAEGMGESITPDMDAVPETPGAVEQMQEDSFATASSDDSGLNMIRRIARRK